MRKLIFSRRSAFKLAASCALLAAATTVAALSGLPAFLGGSQGTAVEWESIPLPPVVEGSFNDPPPTMLNAFTPSFQQLLTGHTVIVSDAQMRQVWRRLFQTPYNASLFDFEDTFVILVGGGSMHPFFGFAITDVESFQASFSPVFFDGNTEETALAVRVVTTYTGIPPPKMDPEWKLVAVKVPREYLNAVIVNRQFIAPP